MANDQILGLDIGKNRTGLARASNLAKLAEPLMTVKTSELIKTLEQLIKEHGYSTIVGLPRNLQGNETSQTQSVRHWVDDARKKLKASFYWQDEALTTKMAEAHKLSDGKKSTYGIDAIAAAIILQDFLETPEVNRKPC
jgi:putative Holliday junction resolvase